jgi:hypothetical protein
MATSSSIISLATGTVGVDRTATIAPQASQLYALGYRFAFRTLGLSDSTEGILTASEVAAIFKAGLALGLFQNYRNKGITADQGTADGQFAANKAIELGAPKDKGLVLWYDLEGTFGVSTQTMLDYLDNWANAVITAGFAPGLYNGPQELLSGSQISSLPNYHAYWQAAAQVSSPQRGYQVYQLNPQNYMVAGINVDVDVVQPDFDGDFATFWTG